MKVLFLYKECPCPPSLNGCRRRGYQFLKTFADAGYDITLLYTDINGPSSNGLEEAQRLCSHVTIVPKTWGWKKRHIQDRFFPGYPLYRPGYHTPEFEKAIAQEVAHHSYDLVYLGQGQLEIYSDLLSGLPILSDPTDAWNHLIKSFLQREESWWKRRYLKRQLELVEQHIRTYYPRMACAVLATDRDARAVKALDLTIQTAVIPNWVDTDYYSPTGGEESDLPTLVFTGVMSSRPNEDAMLWFLHSVYPTVSREVRGLRLFIVGRSPSEKLLSEASRHIGVIVTGEVKDVRPYLEKAWVTICPMQEGAGIKNKILEAMAMGKAIVTTREGAEGIIDSGRDAPMVVTPESDFQEHLLELLRHPSRRRSLGAAARREVSAHFSPSSISRKTLDVCHDVLSHATPVEQRI